MHTHKIHEHCARKKEETTIKIKQTSGPKQRKVIETYQIRDGSFNWTADKCVAVKTESEHMLSTVCVVCASIEK